MKIIDILAMGIRNLLKRKTRTFLTVIGVVVGATAIVIMLSLGIGMNENLNKSIENMGDLTIIDVQANAWVPSGGDNNEYMETKNNLDEALLERIRTWDGVLAVTPFFNYWNMTMEVGKRYEPVYGADVTAIDSSFLPYLRLEVGEGYTPQPGDTNWILFGSRRARMFKDKKKEWRQKDYEALWNADLTAPLKINILKEKITLQIQSNEWRENPSTGIWEQVKLKGKVKKHTLDKVGLIKYKENNYGYDENEWMVYMDYNVVVEMLKEYEKAAKVKAKDSRVGKFDQIRIKVKDIKTSEIIQQKLKDEEEITTYSWLTNMRDEMQKTQGTMQMILGGIGAMSLLVAAIGIANTMFMSIYERTKEIGVMKVLGCPLGGIKSMFLFEASIIGFFGGLLGSGISLIGSYSLNNVEALKKALGNMSGSGMYYGGNMEQGDISVIPLWLILLAVVFATVIGLISGYLPARRATKISALEAIRNE